MLGHLRPLAPVSDQPSFSASTRIENEGQTHSSMGRSFRFGFSIERSVRQAGGWSLFALAFGQTVSCKIGSNGHPFSGERATASLHLSRVSGTAGCQIRKCMHLQAGSVAAGGRPDCPKEETRSPTRRIRNRFALPSGTPPLRCRALHLSSSNWSRGTRRHSQCECETRLKRFTRRFDGRVFLVRS